MTLITSDNNRSVEIGQAAILHSLYSTVVARIKDVNELAPAAVSFLKTGRYSGKEGLKVARQLNLIRDRLSQIPPEAAVYDINNPATSAPWEGHLSAVITSCGNMYTTADGKDLLFELVGILTFVGYSKATIEVA